MVIKLVNEFFVLKINGLRYLATWYKTAYAKVVWLCLKPMQGVK